jgi:hypothetical protein
MAWHVIGGHRNNFIILKTEKIKVFFHTEALTLIMQEVRLPPQCGWCLRSSVGGCRATKDGSWLAPFSRKHISPTFKGQALQEHINYLALRDGNRIFFPKLWERTKKPTTCKNPKRTKTPNSAISLTPCTSLNFFNYLPLIFFRKEVQKPDVSSSRCYISIARLPGPESFTPLGINLSNA